MYRKNLIADFFEGENREGATPDPCALNSEKLLAASPPGSSVRLEKGEGSLQEKKRS